MIGKLIPLALFVAVSVATSGSTGAAEPTETGTGEERPTWGQSHGFSVGVQTQSNLIDVDLSGPSALPGAVSLDEAGKGVLFSLGYAFTEAFVLKVSVSSAKHSSSRDDIEAFYSSAVIETHWRFLPTELGRPYLFAGVGGTALRANTDDPESVSNGGVSVFGAGVLYYLTDHLALDFNGRLDRVNWESPTEGTPRALTYPVDGNGSAGKLHLGGVWEF